MNALKKHRLLSFLLIWFETGLASTAVLGRINMPRLVALTRNGESVTGTIVQLEPGNHRIVRYTYTVDGQVYEASTGYLGGGVPRFEQLQVGDVVPVTYLPEAPFKSVLGDPWPQLVNELVFLLMVALIFPPIAMLGGSRNLPHRPRRNAGG
jgi:hypothetical protein